MLFGSGDINETLRISGVAAANASYIITPGFRGCPGIPQQLIVTVNPLPFASMSISPGFTTFCSGNSVTLTSTTGSSYMWSTGATTQSITVSTAGNYTVTVSNANGCSATSTPTTITVNALPSVTIQRAQLLRALL
jgi:PKD-like domain